MRRVGARLNGPRRIQSAATSSAAFASDSCRRNGKRTDCWEALGIIDLIATVVVIASLVYLAIHTSLPVNPITMASSPRRRNSASSLWQGRKSLLRTAGARGPARDWTRIRLRCLAASVLLMLAGCSENDTDRKPGAAPRRESAPLAVANDNRSPAGTFRDGVLELHIEANGSIDVVYEVGTLRSESRAAFRSIKDKLKFNEGVMFWAQKESDCQKIYDFFKSERSSWGPLLQSP